jgi:GDP-L-fucose synthase
LSNSTRPADFLYDNLLIESNILHQSFLHGVKRLLFLGSSCIYPKFAPQPIAEDSLLTGPLEPTNEAYAIAKISGLMMCKAYSIQHGCDFRSLMPTNLYGPNDNFDPVSSHVIPGLIGKMVRAKESGQSTLALWGSGLPQREFLHVDDLALAAIHVMQLDADSYVRINWPSYAHLNVGTGSDISIRELAETLREIIGFQGTIDWDSTKPDGTPRKLLNTTRIRSLGWHPKITLRDGLRQTVDWFVNNRTSAKK